MELRHLRTFLAVADTLNISAAARQINVTQPALSRHIHDLEYTVGTPLFVRRSGGGLRLTEAGVALQQGGARAIAELEGAMRSARAMPADQNTTVRIGYYGAISVWASIVAPSFERLVSKFPRHSCRMLEASCSAIHNALRAGQLDVAILGPGTHEPDPSIALERACTFPALVMLPANHRLAKRRAIALSDLAEETVIGLMEMLMPGRYETFSSACAAAGFVPKLELSAASLPELMAKVKLRMAVTIIGSLAREIPHPGLTFIPLKPPGVPLALYVGRAKECTTAARELAAMMIAECRRLYPTV